MLEGKVTNMRRHNDAMLLPLDSRNSLLDHKRGKVIIYNLKAFDFKINADIFLLRTDSIKYSH